MVAAGLLLMLPVLSDYDVGKRLLFTHIPKNAGTSIRLGLSTWYAQQPRAPLACNGFDYLATPAGNPERLRAKWSVSYRLPFPTPSMLGECPVCSTRNVT